MACALDLRLFCIFQFSVGGFLVNARSSPRKPRQLHSTPIKHVIVIIGENRSFDHVFATYVPKHGQTVVNLLSEGIVNADGTPGPNFSKAEQRAAADTASDAFLLNPEKLSFANDSLPAPLVGGPKDSYVAGNSLTLAEAIRKRVALELLSIFDFRRHRTDV